MKQKLKTHQTKYLNIKQTKYKLKQTINNKHFNNELQ